MGQPVVHADAVHSAVERIAAILRRIRKPNVETVILEGEGQFLLKRIGWHEGERINNTVVFVRLVNDKIWIEEDWTEEGIATELLRAGVPRDDIVLAFHPPQLRHMTEFASA